MPSTADIYLIGGGEDGPQALAAQRLIADGGLHRAVEPGRGGARRLRRLPAVRALFLRQGRQVRRAGAARPAAPTGARPGPSASSRGDIDPRLGLPPLTGFENHGGRTHLGPGVSPLARVTAGHRQRRPDRGRLARQDPRHLLARPGARPQPSDSRSATALGDRRGYACPRSTTPGPTGSAANGSPRRAPHDPATRHRTDDELGRYACMTDTLIAPRGIDLAADPQASQHQPPASDPAARMSWQHRLVRFGVLGAVVAGLGCRRRRAAAAGHRRRDRGARPGRRRRHRRRRRAAALRAGAPHRHHPGLRRAARRRRSARPPRWPRP